VAVAKNTKQDDAAEVDDTTVDEPSKSVDATEEQPNAEVPEDPDEEAGGGRFSRFTRRLMEPGESRKVLSAMWETSDRAKTEAVRMVAREVRSYLDALELKEDLLHLVRSHSLEINASLRLKPLSPESEGDDDDESR
jgi:hypothetical protein